MRFRTILADPPWSFGGGYGTGESIVPRRNRKNGKGGSIHPPDTYYPCLPTAEMMTFPVQSVADDNAALLMWSTWAHLPEAIRLIEAWGFQYKTAIPWVKMTQHAAPKRGFGFHVANCSEPLLIGIRGGGIAPGPSRIGIMFHPSGGHSSKPEDQYVIAERYPGPYLEIFHRPRAGMFPPRDGWTFVGNEVDGLDAKDALERLAALPPPALDLAG